MKIYTTIVPDLQIYVNKIMSRRFSWTLPLYGSTEFYKNTVQKKDVSYVIEMQEYKMHKKFIVERKLF